MDNKFISIPLRRIIYGTCFSSLYRRFIDKFRYLYRNTLAV